MVECIDERRLMLWVNVDLRESGSGLCCWMWGVGFAGGCCSSGSGSSSGGSDSNIGGRKEGRERRWEGW